MIDTTPCEVYHTKELVLPPILNRDYTELTFPDDYDHVATVNGNDLDVAFKLTNHISHDWTTNKGVKAHRKPCRSTSVGDVVVLADGTKWRCNSMGWEELVA